jgi:hypothetical protein
MARGVVVQTEGGGGARLAEVGRRGDGLLGLAGLLHYWVG